MNLGITTYCEIKDDTIYLNGESLASFPKEKLLRSTYDMIDMKYPKFHKMDEMSKLGLIASEVLLSKVEGNTWNPDMVGVFIQTEHGCLDTDITHQEMINNKKASPAVFVYTLPNIVIGEITIKNKWHGESALFVGEWSNLTNLVGYCKSLFLDGKINTAIIGHIDAFRTQYSAKLALIEIESSKPEKPIEKITELYK